MFFIFTEDINDAYEYITQFVFMHELALEKGIVSKVDYELHIGNNSVYIKFTLLKENERIQD